MLTGGDPPFLMWSGVDQGTVAALVADGLHYQCFVWVNQADWRVEALCKVTHPDGSKSVVFHNMIDTASASAITTVRFPLDCPKIIAVGTTFVVHWLAASTVDGGGVAQWSLFRATMDMESFDASVGGWTTIGSLAVYEPYALYDVAPLLGSDTDFLLARSITDDTTIRVERYDGFGLIDTDWQTDIDPAIEGRVLAIYGHEADDDVIVTYERTGMGEEEGGALWSWRLDASSGTAEAADVQTFTVFSFTDPHGPFDNSPVLSETGARWCQVGHCRVAANQVAVVGEAVLIDIVGADKPYSHIHHLAYRRIDSSDATRLGNEWWCPHLAMCSLPFAYDNGTTAAGSQPNVYCVVSYKSLYATSDWEQATIFCVDLNYSRWGAEDSGQQLRPRPVATLQSVGIPDARISGFHPEAEDADLTDPPPLNGPVKRVNHLSNVAIPPPYGPQIKTRTVAVGIWARMGAVGTDPDELATDQSATAFTDAEIDPVTGEPTIPTTIDVRAGELQPENNGVSGFVIHLEDPWTIFRDSTDPTQPVDNFAGSYPRSACQSVEAGRGLAIFGGTPYYYDGERVGEMGFPWGPELLQLAAGEAGGGELTGDTTYRYYVVATRRDAQGTVHRSRPSRVASVDVEGANNAVQIRIRTCTLSLWESGVFYPTAHATQFEVFRTEGGGAVFYRLYGARAGIPGMSPSDTPTNNPLAIWGYVDFEDTLADAELVAQGAAPFTLGDGGFIELTPQTVPAMTCPCTWQGRLWGADAVDPSLLWYSDEILPEFASDYYRAPEFNDANTFRIDGIGEVTSLRPMGDALWIFTASGVFALRGNCNDGTGQGADLTLEPVHEGVGCVEPRSVVLGPTGVLFQSSKGIHWLDRGGALDYLTAGASVEDDVIDAGNVRAASIMPNKQQVRVACNGRPVTTYTTTWEVSQDTPGATFSITLTGLGAPGLIASTENADGDTDTEVATRLVEDIAALLAVRSSGLHLYIASVALVGDDVVVVWQPDVVPSYTDLPDGPGNSLIATDTSSLAVQPRVLVLDMLQRRWSRFDLPDVSATERLNEVVGGCVWDGCYVALHQGGLRIERKTTDALAYTDDSSAGAPLPVRIDVKTSPIHLAGIAGAHRVRRMYIQATKHNASQFNVGLDYFWSGNYDVPDDIDEDITVDTTTPAGLEVCPRHQKLQAFAMRIHEPVGVINEQNVTIHSLTFLAGVRKGIQKRSDAMRGRT